ncbi:MAG: glycosyltransferase family A protein [Rikenellaceae bacterium]
MEPLTVIYFSCRRLHLLYESVKSFIENNTYPVTDFIIVNDSGDSKIHDQLKFTYPGATLVLNEKNMGLIESIDRGYAEIKTEYFFHSEDDWKVIQPGAIERSFDIMLIHPLIEEVWLADYNNHPLEPEIYTVNGNIYKLACDNYQKGLNGYNDFAWHGFTTACGLKRLSDYKKVGPYATIPWLGTIWHREQAIGERYHNLGYRTACLLSEYAVNIGYGQSEYKTGMEK